MLVSDVVSFYEFASATNAVNQASAMKHVAVHDSNTFWEDEHSQESHQVPAEMSGHLLAEMACTAQPSPEPKGWDPRAQLRPRGTEKYLCTVQTSTLLRRRNIVA